MQYVRLTVIGTRRKADVALPAEQAVEAILPEIVDLLDEPAAAGTPLMLTTLLGLPVDQRLGFAEQGIGSGAVLNLGQADQVPQPPDVAEVTETVADTAATRSDRWTPRLTRYALAAGVALTAAVTGGLLASGPVAIAVLAVVCAAAAAGGAVEERLGNSRAAASLFGLGAGAAYPLAQLLSDLFIPATESPAWLCLWWVLLWLVIGIVYGIGARRSHLWAGSLIAILSSVAALLTVLLPLPIFVMAGVVGIAAAALLGLAPSIALTAAGVARLDDAAIEGGSIQRREVTTAIEAAFTAQTALTVVLSIPLVVSVLILAGGGSWAVALAAALTVFVLARVRLFPLAPARTVLLLAGAVPLLWWFAAADGVSVAWRAGAAAGACALLLIAALARFSATAQARLRRFLGVLEAVAVVAMVPLLLGLIGIFGDLLGAFQ